MLNQFTAVCRVGTTPEKFGNDGENAGVFFRGAIERNYKNPAGEYDVDWVTLKAWRTTAEQVSRLITKGRLISFTGTLMTREYQTKEGVKQTDTYFRIDQFQLLDRKPTEGGETATDTATDDTEPTRPARATTPDREPYL